jgi:hypothetical protein
MKLFQFLRASEFYSHLQFLFDGNHFNNKSLGKATVVVSVAIHRKKGFRIVAPRAVGECRGWSSMDQFKKARLELNADFIFSPARKAPVVLKRED